jgi:hypothetical protein
MTSLLVATGTVALTAWALAFVLVRETARARRPDPPYRPGPRADEVAEPLAEPADPALRRVLAAVRRHPGGTRLRDAVVAAAVEGLLEREALTVEHRSGDLWVRVAGHPSDSLAPHERVLLERLRAASARAAGPLPLAALRPTKGVDADRAWLTGLVDAALGWARRGGYLRDLLPASVRGWFRAGMFVLVELFTAAALVTYRPDDDDTVFAAVIFSLFLAFGAGTVLTSPLVGHGLTSVGAAALTGPAARPATPPRPLATRIARLLATSGRRNRAWSPGNETWREVRVDTHPMAGGGDDPRSVRGANLALLGVMAVVGVVLARETASTRGLADADFVVFLLVTWWGAWLGVTVRALRRLWLALSDLRTGPVVSVGPVVQRRTTDSGGKNPHKIPVVAVDVGAEAARNFVVSDELFERLTPGTLVRVAVTPRLHHLVSIEPVPAPGGVGLPPSGAA